MKQHKNTDVAQVLYQGRWVNKEYFRAYVYNSTGQKLAESFDDFSQLIDSGLWFASKEEVEPKEPINIRAGRKSKDGSVS